jgi:hypothetical protein
MISAGGDGMTRLGAIFWGGLVLASGFATFNVKYAVQGIEEELIRIRRQTVAEQQEIRVLTAEWAYLNQPERLAELNRSFLQLAPMTAKQMLGRIEEIALRAPSVGVPAVMFDTIFAAHPPAATPAANRPAVMLASAAPSASPLAAPPAGTTRTEGKPVAEVERAQIPASGVQTLPATGTNTEGADAQLADAAGEARAHDASGDGTTALAEALRLLGLDGGGQAPRVRLAKATPASLDALISKIADTR